MLTVLSAEKNALWQLEVPDNIHYPTVQQGTSVHSAELSMLSRAQSTLNLLHTPPTSSWSLRLFNIHVHHHHHYSACTISA